MFRSWWEGETRVVLRPTGQTLGADMANCVDINAGNLREVLELAVVEATASASG